MEDQWPPNRALFSVFERAAISVVVMFLFGLGSFLVFQGQGRFYGGEPESWFHEIAGMLAKVIPYGGVDLGMIVLLGTVLFGWDCFRRLRREPLTVTRNLWCLAAILLLGGSIQAENYFSIWFESVDRHLLSSRGMAGWLSLAVAALLPPVLGLLTVALAGELSHSARLRMMAEEIHEDIPRFHGDREALRRRHDLIAAVRGMSFRTYVTAGRFVVQLALFAVSTPLVWICVMGDTVENELRFDFPQVEQFHEPQHWLTVNNAGQVFFDGDLMAEADDQDCSRLVDLLKHLAGFGRSLSFGLSIDDNVPVQRFINIMNAMAKAGVKEPPVIF